MVFFSVILRDQNQKNIRDMEVNKTLLKSEDLFEEVSMKAGEDYAKYFSKKYDLSEYMDDKIELETGELLHFIMIAFESGAQWLRDEIKN